MAKRATAGHSMRPRAAVQPISGGQGAGEGADESGEGGAAFERRVDGDVGEDGEQGEHAGDRIGEAQQQQRAKDDSGEGDQQAMGQADAPGGERTSCSADHASVGLALEGFIERSGAGRDERDAGQGFEQTDVEAGNGRAHRAEIEAGPGGDDDQRGDPGLEELHVVGEQIGGGLGANPGRGVKLRLSLRSEGRAVRHVCHGHLGDGDGAGDARCAQWHRGLVAGERNRCMNE